MTIFNSDFEVSLRILLLLSQTRRALSKEEIVNFDFITVYSADFGIGDENLHGDNGFKYGEIASRQEKARIALKQLVVKGLISVDTNNGFQYSITHEGMRFANAMESTYSAEYKRIASEVMIRYSNYSDTEVSMEIDKNAVASARGMKSCII